MAERDIGGEPGRQRHGDPAEGRAGSGNGARLRPDRDRARLLRRLDPMIQPLDRIDEGVGAGRGKRRDLRYYRLARSRPRDRWRAIDSRWVNARLKRPQLHFIEKRKQLIGVVGLYPQGR